METDSNMLKNSKLLLLFLLALTQCKSYKANSAYSTDSLKIIPLSKNSYVHITYLQTESSGKVACNGYIFMNKGEALVFDTPSDSESTRELLRWLEDIKGQKVIGLVANHFHIDALGGISEFHKKGIATYAHEKTSKLVEIPEKKPQNTFDDQLILKVGDKEVINQYYGEAHTVDNIVSYVPEEELIFGGCMVKMLNAGYGNLDDANVSTWSATVQKIKEAHPKLKTVIPGHGPHGGPELLDYTIALFKNK
ncbi:MAG: BcII family subclass B1 metallo-beta-lactamase [Maribacter sp.]